MAGGPKWFRQILAGVTVEEVQRFDAALDATTSALDRRPPGEKEAWRDAARRDVEHAETRRAAFKLEAAWAALKSAQRELIRPLDASELVAEARVLRNEADDKLTGWRHKSVEDLLPPELLDTVARMTGGMTVERTVRTPGSAPANRSTGRAGRQELGSESGDTKPVEMASDVAPCDTSLVEDLRNRLLDATLLLDEHSDNAYHKFRILRRAVISTSVAFGIFLGVLLAIVALEWVPEALLPDRPDESPLGSWQLLIVIMTLGVIGAFFSSATELRRGDDKTRIPDLRVRYTLMGMRPVVGAAGAVVVIVILQSALGEVVTLESSAIFGVAIAAGFTERLVTRTVASAANAIS